MITISLTPYFVRVRFVITNRSMVRRRLIILQRQTNVWLDTMVVILIYFFFFFFLRSVNYFWQMQQTKSKDQGSTELRNPWNSAKWQEYRERSKLTRSQKKKRKKKNHWPAEDALLLGFLLLLPLRFQSLLFQLRLGFLLRGFSGTPRHNV